MLWRARVAKKDRKIVDCWSSDGFWDFMNAHNMFVDVSVRAVINCSLPLLHGLCIRYYCLLLMLCRIALFHRTNINGHIALSCNDVHYPFLHIHFNYNYFHIQYDYI